MRDCSVPRVIRSPSRPTNSGAEAGHPDRGVAFLAAFAFHIDHGGTVVERAHVPDIDQAEFFRPQSR